MAIILLIWKCTEKFVIMCSYIKTSEKPEKIRMKNESNRKIAKNKKLKDTVRGKINNENEDIMSEAEIKKLALIQFLILAVLFFVVILIMAIVSALFGKTAGTVALILIAGLISVYLFKGEIKERLQKK